jgi:hypothetical protein
MRILGKLINSPGLTAEDKKIRRSSAMEKMVGWNDATLGVKSI